MKKIGIIVTTFAIAFSFAVPQVQAVSVLTESQIASVIGLLAAFNADSETVNRVEESLRGRNLSGNTSPQRDVCLNLSNSLYLGLNDRATNGEVTKLQEFLTKTGDFTFGRTTGYFGPATERAVKRWQASNGVVSSGSPETTGYGVAGPQTRREMRCGSDSIDQYNPVLTPPSSTGWSTYSNSNLGFSFKYPSNWVLEGPDTGFNPDSLARTEVRVFPNVTDAAKSHIFVTDPGSNLDIVRNAQLYNADNIDHSKTKSEDVTINGMWGIQRTQYFKNNDCTQILRAFKGDDGRVYGTHIVQCPTHEGNLDNQMLRVINSLSIFPVSENITTKPSCSVSANPSGINLGESTTITYMSTNATSVSGKGLTANGPVNGSLVVQPYVSGPYTYTLTVTGSGGSATCSTVVQVNEQTSSGLTDSEIQSITSLIRSFGQTEEFISLVDRVLRGDTGGKVVKHTLTTSQTDSLINLLKSFGADSYTIAVMENIFDVGSSPSAYGTLDQNEVTLDPYSFILSGLAYNTDRVLVYVVKSSYTGATDWNSLSQQTKGNGAAVSNTSSVTNNKWSTTFGGFLSGNYKVYVYNYGSSICTPGSGCTTTPNLIASGPLTINPASTVQAPTCSAWASVSEVFVNEPFKVYWSSTNANYAEGKYGDKLDASGQQGIQSGTVGTYTYPITVYGDGGQATCSASVEVVEDNRVGIYEGYFYDSFAPGGLRLFIRTENISKDYALRNCKLNANNNPTKDVYCTWNGDAIFDGKKG